MITMLQAITGKSEIDKMGFKCDQGGNETEMEQSQNVHVESVYGLGRYHEQERETGQSVITAYQELHLSTCLKSIENELNN